MNVKRLVLYLFLNAVVSASVALCVLWLWDQTHPLLPLPATATAAVAQVTPTSVPLALSPSAPAPVVSQAPAATPTIYVVQPGDTLGTIAQRFGVTVDVLMAANGITNPNLVSAGE